MKKGAQSNWLPFLVVLMLVSGVSMSVAAISVSGILIMPAHITSGYVTAVVMATGETIASTSVQADGRWALEALPENAKLLLLGAFPDDLGLIWIDEVLADHNVVLDQRAPQQIPSIAYLDSWPWILLIESLLVDPAKESLTASEVIFLSRWIIFSEIDETDSPSTTSVTVTDPGAGNVLTAGTNYRYYWETENIAYGLSEMFDVDYSVDGGSTWVQFQGVSNDGSSPWDIPSGIDSDSCQLRMRSRNYPEAVGVSAIFSIHPPEE